MEADYKLIDNEERHQYAKKIVRLETELADKNDRNKKA